MQSQQIISKIQILTFEIFTEMWCLTEVSFFHHSYKLIYLWWQCSIDIFWDLHSLRYRRTKIIYLYFNRIRSNFLHILTVTDQEVFKYLNQLYVFQQFIVTKLLENQKVLLKIFIRITYKMNHIRFIFVSKMLILMTVKHWILVVPYRVIRYREYTIM